MTEHPPTLRLVDTPERGMNYVRIYVDPEPGRGPFTYLKRMVAAARRVGGDGWFLGYRSALPPVDRRFHVESEGEA